MLTEKRGLVFDLIVAIGIVFVSVPLVLIFKLKPLSSAFLFFLVPSVYLIFRKPQNLKRIFVGSVFVGIVFGFIFDFLAVLNRAWQVPISQLVIKYRLFGFQPVDEIIWFVLWASVIIVFYEHFLEHDRSDKISLRFKSGLIPAALFTLGILVIFLINPTGLAIKYSYFILGLPAVFIPLGYGIIKKPELLYKIVKIAPFFFVLFLAHELTALYTGQWSFDGFYIGNINILGLKFPLEEFLFWIILGSTVVIIIYEFFVDDGE